MAQFSVEITPLSGSVLGGNQQLDRLEAMVPAVRNASLVVSWFGDDLRAGTCTIRPKVEVAQKATSPAWEVDGIVRAAAPLVSRDGKDRPVYGGTPADFSVVQAIREMKARGLSVTFYPFVMMDVPAGNALPDPWSDNAAAIGQPAFPWRGRITCWPAAGYAGTVDKTAAAASQVAAFFGSAQPGDFSVSGTRVIWTGGADWGFRRMVLHYAHLCKAAGSVDAFLIGSEMRGLTQIRDGAASYPAVSALRSLAAAVGSILGPDTKISYAAEWSEYFGHQPQDGSGDVLFHLDPLWADVNIDFIGIDNYMPLSDWRDGWEHADALVWPSIYDRAYLQSNIAGGEGFDWFYASDLDRAAQTRTLITDGTTPPSGTDYISALPAGPTDREFGPNSVSGINVTIRSSTFTLVSSVTMPLPLADGIIFKIGSNAGLWLGLVSGKLRLLVQRQQDGVARECEIDAADLAGRSIEVVAIVDTAAGMIRLAVNRDIVADASFPDAITGIWVQNNSGGYGKDGTTTVGFGVGRINLDPWSGTLDSNARMWSALPSTAHRANEAWLFRTKDLQGWWSNPHHNRPSGVRSLTATAWVPQSKPIRFTELGCPAVDRGTNQPNVFHDPKSSESFFPYFSRGWRDDAIQRAYLEATYLYWRDPANNPASTEYAERMVDIAQSAAWTWDARPYPFFPELSDIWSDGNNWRLGHWLTGRLGAVSLAALVRHLCLRSGLRKEWIDVSGLTGAADGYTIFGLPQ